MPMNFIAYYASIPSHSPYYPTHSPHHRPVPFAHITFPPDPPHNHSDVECQSQSNPTHGQKVTTDSAGRRDPKLENSGPVAKDSLAAESLRSGGSFSAGNPTGISGVRGSAATFTVDPTEGGSVHVLHGKKEDLGSGKASHPDRNIMETNSSGGLSALKYSGGGDSSGTEGRGSRHTAGAGGSSSDTRDYEALKNKVPNTTNSTETLEPGLDWSKVSKDTHLTTDIGGPNDPGRAAAVHMAGQATRQDQGIGHSGGNIGDSNNTFDLLNASERVPEVEDPSRG